ncbi:hypothetical protein [Haloarcula nitratireducens]|uniref:Cbb3-type cytochrome c oxidase subunit I n=1 Tax=Haloarcula nitratireducens TaxID=2487749 RepID=A0AAW4PDY7_9EURY|nr:hypothetical protein [Halomicroarcula nitratireducens]MBX0296481.1 hypothetical protein [Halomicroarcula nitratireducens]
MAAIPGSVDTDLQPPMTVPLRHFWVGLTALLAGSVVGVGLVAGVVPGLGRLALVHLFLIGWVCITIMGAMTQFVPVWSGVPLHSRRLAAVQLALVTAGLIGFVASLLLGALALLPVFGTAMLAGFWVFAYNVGRTLARAGRLDVTERHFALSLGFFVVLTAFGLALAVDFTRPFLAQYSVSRSNVVLAHATLAVFGAVLTTVYGALYQLATMFTQTELHGIDDHLKRTEEVGHPVGVALLAVGRLVGSEPAAALGGLLVCLAALSFGAILARKLFEMRVERTPMHTRYAVVALSLSSWALLTVPAWATDPLARAHLLGGPGTTHLLVLGTVGFVVLGTLYHVVPFVVWVHRYSDLLGFEDVPMIDDLYHGRLAAADAALLISGTALLAAADLVPAAVALRGVGGVLVGLGVFAFAVNMRSVLRNHSRHSVGGLLLGRYAPTRAGLSPDRGSSADGRRE